MKLDPVTGAAAGGFWSGRVTAAASIALFLATVAVGARGYLSRGALADDDCVIELQEVDLRDLDEEEEPLDDEELLDEECSCDDLELEDLADPEDDEDDEEGAVDDEILRRR